LPDLTLILTLPLALILILIRPPGGRRRLVDARLMTPHRTIVASVGHR
jgi:hypothetical protein